MTQRAEKTEKQRTIQQNRALHLYFQLIADRLNDAGLDMRVVLKPDMRQYAPVLDRALIAGDRT